MKMVLLMYLEEDEPCVRRLLEREEVRAYSRLTVEGHGPGERGWYGEVAPFHSRMVMAIVPPETADRLLEAVEECRGVVDPGHPIRAAQVDVERMTSCLCGGRETPIP